MNDSNTVYQRLLKESLDTIQKQITNLERKNHGLRAITDKTTEEINGLKMQYQEILGELQNFNQREQLTEIQEGVLNTLDTKTNENLSSVQEVRQNIEELKALREQLQTSRQRRKIDKKIQKKQEIIKKLQTRNARIDKIEKAIMLPQLKVNQMKQKIRLTQYAKAESARAALKDNEQLMAMLDPENSIKDNLMATIYDIKGKYYQMKLNHSMEVLNEMQKTDSLAAIKGANAITIGKKAVSKLRQRRDKQKMIVNQQPVNNQTTQLAVR